MDAQRADTEVRRPGAERVESRKWRVDTEVRAPAALVLGPFRGMSVSARIGGVGPSGSCPLGTLGPHLCL